MNPCDRPETTPGERAEYIAEKHWDRRFPRYELVDDIITAIKAGTADEERKRNELLEAHRAAMRGAEEEIGKMRKALELAADAIEDSWLRDQVLEALSTKLTIDAEPLAMETEPLTLPEGNFTQEMIAEALKKVREQAQRPWPLGGGLILDTCHCRKYK